MKVIKETMGIIFHMGFSQMFSRVNENTVVNRLRGLSYSKAGTRQVS